MTHPTSLAAQVAAWNNANRAANELAVTLANSFRSLVGEKIICNGGGLMKRYESLKPPRQNATTAAGVDCYHNISLHRLSFMVKACEMHDDGQRGGAHYAETYIEVGEIGNHVLTKINDPWTERRTDYTVELVKALRENLEKAEQTYRHAEGALSPFNRYDH